MLWRSLVASYSIILVERYTSKVWYSLILLCYSSSHLFKHHKMLLSARYHLVAFWLLELHFFRDVRISHVHLELQFFFPACVVTSRYSQHERHLLGVRKVGHQSHHLRPKRIFVVLRNKYHFFAVCLEHFEAKESEQNADDNEWSHTSTTVVGLWLIIITQELLRRENTCCRKHRSSFYYRNSLNHVKFA